MPIRLNLLAEQQEAEEMRRRDPVKRATWGAGVVIAVVVLWCGWLQMKIMGSSSELAQYEAEWKSMEKEFKELSDKQKQTIEIEGKLQSLETLANNRFLWANTLNALQLIKVSDVQLLKLKTLQTYEFIEGTKPKTNTQVRAGVTNRTITPGKPATAKEHIKLTLDAKDASARPGEQVNKYRESLLNQPYFKERLQAVDSARLIGLSPPQVEAADPTKTFVLFTLECTFPEKVR